MSDIRVLGCEEAIRLLAAYLDGELQPVDEAELERHLAFCRSCYSRHEFERRLKEQLAGLGHEPVRPEFRDRVRALVGRFAGHQDHPRTEARHGGRHLQ